MVMMNDYPKNKYRKMGPRPPELEAIETVKSPTKFVTRFYVMW